MVSSIILYCPNILLRAAIEYMLDTCELAVNGTLMLGLELNGNLQQVGAKFGYETTTAPIYRLWSILVPRGCANDDRHPAMMRVSQGGASISLEIWSVPLAGLAQILHQEPAGLCIGKVKLADNREVLGVLGEPFLCEGQPEITHFGGWRNYIKSIQTQSAF